jgi:hypothetical protein
MSERAAYSRVYWSIIDDAKFANVYDDDRALAAWTRLLLVADMAWPASAHIPVNTRRQSVAILVGAGLIDLQAGSRYRVHGLDAERNRRKESATHPPTNRGPNGDQSGTGRSPVVPGERGLRRDETSKDETSPPAGAREADDQPEFEALQWLGRHGCYLRPGDGYHQKLILAVERFGINRVVGTMDRLASAGVMDGDTKGFIFGATDALFPRPDLKAVERGERADEAAANFDRAAAATQRMLARQRGETA